MTDRKLAIEKWRDRLAEEYVAGWELEPLVQARAKIDLKFSFDEAVKLFLPLVEKLDEMVKDIRQLDGTCPHDTWKEASQLLAALDAKLNNVTW